MNHIPIDTTSMQGLLSTILFIVLGHLFMAMSVISVLQGLSYFFAVILAVDTLTGNNLKSWLSHIIKSKLNAYKKYKSKRSKSNKVS